MSTQATPTKDALLRDFGLFLERKDLASPADVTSVPAGAILNVSQATALLIPEMTMGRAIRIVHCFSRIFDNTGSSKLAVLAGNMEFDESSSGSGVRVTTASFAPGVNLGSPALSGYVSVAAEEEIFIWSDYPNLGRLVNGLNISPGFLVQNLDGAAAHSITMATRVLYEIWQQRWDR